MRAVVAVLLAGLMVVPGASAIHDQQIQPAVEAGRAFRDTIMDVNRTLGDIEAQVGDDPKLDQARQKLVDAGKAHNAGNDWLALSHLLEAVAIARRTQVEYENRDASDQDAAYFADMETRWEESRAWIGDVHQRLEDLQSTGIDLYTLDHALLAGSIMTEGERLHRSWQGIAQAWERGQRDGQVKNALAAFSYGVILHAKIADRILTNALENHPDEPVGPVVGNSTLEGVVDALRPTVSNRSVSFDQALSGVINANIASGEWLAALGSMVRWSQRQAPAAVEHVLDEPEDRFSAEAVTHHLADLVENDTTLDQIDALGPPGAQARHSLAQATGVLRIVENALEEGRNGTGVTLRAAHGLGALSAAHTSLAILKVSAGEDPPRNFIHLPVSSAGEFGLSETGSPDDDGGMSVGSAWLWVAAAGALVVAGIVLRRRR